MDLQRVVDFFTNESNLFRGAGEVTCSVADLGLLCGQAGGVEECLEKLRVLNMLERRFFRVGELFFAIQRDAITPEMLESVLSSLRASQLFDTHHPLLNSRFVKLEFRNSQNTNSVLLVEQDLKELLVAGRGVSNLESVLSALDQAELHFKDVQELLKAVDFVVKCDQGKTHAIWGRLLRTPLIPALSGLKGTESSHEVAAFVAALDRGEVEELQMSRSQEVLCAVLLFLVDGSVPRTLGLLRELVALREQYTSVAALVSVCRIVLQFKLEHKRRTEKTAASKSASKSTAAADQARGHHSAGWMLQQHQQKHPTSRAEQEVELQRVKHFLISHRLCGRAQGGVVDNVSAQAPLAGGTTSHWRNRREVQVVSQKELDKLRSLSRTKQGGAKVGVAAAGGPLEKKTHFVIKLQHHILRNRRARRRQAHNQRVKLQGTNNNAFSSNSARPLQPHPPSSSSKPSKRKSSGAGNQELAQTTRLHSSSPHTASPPPIPPPSSPLKASSRQARGSTKFQSRDSAVSFNQEFRSCSSVSSHPESEVSISMVINNVGRLFNEDSEDDEGSRVSTAFPVEVAEHRLHPFHATSIDEGELPLDASMVDATVCGQLLDLLPAAMSAR